MSSRDPTLLFTNHHGDTKATLYCRICPVELYPRNIQKCNFAFVNWIIWGGNRIEFNLFHLHRWWILATHISCFYVDSAEDVYPNINLNMFKASRGVQIIFMYPKNFEWNSLGSTNSEKCFLISYNQSKRVSYSWENKNYSCLFE